MNKPWTFATGGKVVFGPGALAQAAAEVAALGAWQVLLLSSRSAAGAAARVAADLDRLGCQVHPYGGIPPGLPVAAVERALADVAAVEWDVVVAVGGGSVLNAAKLLGALNWVPGPLRRFYGQDRIPGPGRPVIAVPTTAGTGAAVTPVALVTDPERQAQVPIASRHLCPRTAIVDPDLLADFPPDLAATAGLTALAHAAEAWLAAGGNPLADAMALAAVRHLAGHLRAAAGRHDPGGAPPAVPADPGTRAGLALGSTLAGLARAAAGEWATGALAGALVGRHGLPYGLSAAVLLPRTVEVLMRARPGRARPLLQALGARRLPADDAGCAAAVVAELLALGHSLGVPELWRRRGVPLTRGDLQAMAAAAAAASPEGPAPWLATAAEGVYLAALADLGAPALSAVS